MHEILPGESLNCRGRPIKQIAKSLAGALTRPQGKKVPVGCSGRWHGSHLPCNPSATESDPQRLPETGPSVSRQAGDWVSPCPRCAIYIIVRSSTPSIDLLEEITAKSAKSAKDSMSHVLKHVKFSALQSTTSHCSRFAAKTCHAIRILQSGCDFIVRRPTVSLISGCQPSSWTQELSPLSLAPDYKPHAYKTLGYYLHICTGTGERHGQQHKCLPRRINLARRY